MGQDYRCFYSSQIWNVYRYYVCRIRINFWAVLYHISLISMLVHVVDVRNSDRIWVKRYVFTAPPVINFHFSIVSLFVEYWRWWLFAVYLFIESLVHQNSERQLIVCVWALLLQRGMLSFNLWKTSYNYFKGLYYFSGNKHPIF